MEGSDPHIEGCGVSNQSLGFEGPVGLFGVSDCGSVGWWTVGLTVVRTSFATRLTGGTDGGHRMGFRPIHFSDLGSLGVPSTVLDMAY